MIVESSLKEFKWNACENAETYILEISSSDQFQSDLETVDYYKQNNITTTSFKINSSFQKQETNYYWRVTATNSLGSKMCAETFSFYVKSPAVEEVQFDLGEADDWMLHEVGSYADIAIDNSNFFGNNQKSLKISFKEEDVNQGPGHEESDGWIIVTKVVEKSIYGTDAIYLNCFYAGQDATVLIRLVDRDNEYWYCPIQLSFNAQQTVILKFSDFVQRYADVTVANETFDYERIKYMEVVFEKTFGDGVFLLSNMKAIKFSNYKDLFVQKLDFSEYEEDQFTYENYEFEKTIHDKYELQMNYYGSATEEHGKINGYGFLKVVVKRYLYTGDAIKISVKYTGEKGSNVIMRIYEEDTDRWSYKIPFSSLTVDEYSTIVIPYTAFAKSQVTGDGKRQFSYIINIQFGLEGEYSTGSLFFKDFEIVEKKDYALEETRVVGSDGLVENFDNYHFAADMFNIWTVSVDNKDEYIDLNNLHLVGENNVFAGQFKYKSDMFAALYYLPVSVSNSFSSLSILLKDASVKPLNNDNVSHIESVNADVVIYVRTNDGQIYHKELKQLDKIWKLYDIPFASFVPDDNKNTKTIVSTDITHIGLSMQYYYKNKIGMAMPLYTMDNPVYVDDIYLTNKTAYHEEIKERVISFADDVGLIDDFESYESASDLNFFWHNAFTHDYQKRELSDNVSVRGGEHSMKLQYKVQNASPSYRIAPYVIFDTSKETCKGFKVSIAAEKQATVYINFYVMVESSSVQFRATLTSVNLEWTEYVIGFDKLTNESGGKLKMTSPFNVYGITFGMVYNGGTKDELSNIYVDNFYFDKSIDSYSVFDRNVITE